MANRFRIDSGSFMNEQGPSIVFFVVIAAVVKSPRLTICGVSSVLKNLRPISVGKARLRKLLESGYDSCKGRVRKFVVMIKLKENVPGREPTCLLLYLPYPTRLPVGAKN